MFTIPCDVKEPTHYSKRVGHEVPGVVAVLCESIAGPHQLIAAKKTQPAQSNKRKKRKEKESIKQPRWQRNQERHKFAYLTMENGTSARFTSACFIFIHLADVLSTTLNDLFCSCVDDVRVSIWWQMFNLVFLSLKRWFEIISRIIRTHLASIMT